VEALVLIFSDNPIKIHPISCAPIQKRFSPLGSELVVIIIAGSLGGLSEVSATN